MRGWWQSAVGAARLGDVLRFGLLALVLVIVSACRHAAVSTTPNSRIVLSGATIHDGTGRTIRNGHILVEQGRISYVGSAPPPGLSPDVPRLALGGKFIIPGLIDAHVHFGQTGFFEARPDYVDLSTRFPYPEVLAFQKRHPQRYFPAYLGSGITAVYDLGGAPWTIALQHSAENDLGAPRIAATGPMITPAPAEAIARFNAPFEKIMVSLEHADIGRQLVRHATALGSSGIKIWGIPGPDELPRLRAVMDEIGKHDSWALAHATSLDAAKTAVQLGARVLVHSVEDQPVDAAFIALAQDRGIIYIPTLSVHRAVQQAMLALLGEPLPIEDTRGLLDARTRAVLDGAAGLADAALRARLQERTAANAERLNRREGIMAENLRRLHAAGVTIATGSDAGNPGQLHGLSLITELEAMQGAGIDPIELLTMATVNGALAMGRSSDLGRIAEGMRADLVVLDRDPAQDISHLRSVSAVMKGGRWALGASQ